MAIADSVVWRKCPPFCEKNVGCPEHHELLQAIVNCTDQLGHLSNLDILRNSVEKYEKRGWHRNEVIPDAAADHRLPLVHWAASLGKCNALEWMINTGFDPTVTVAGVGENALHRCILCLYKARTKFTLKELKPKFRKIVNLLPQLIGQADSVNRDTPLHLAAAMLSNTDSRLSFFHCAVETMALQTQKMDETEQAHALDASNDDGNTVLHILAGVFERAKADHACSAINVLLRSGCDKTIRNNEGQTPLDIAMNKGHSSIVDELVKMVSPNSFDESPLPHHDSGDHVTMVDLNAARSPIHDLVNGKGNQDHFNDIICDELGVQRDELSPSSSSDFIIKVEPKEELPSVDNDGVIGQLESPGQTSNTSVSPFSFSDVVNSPLLKHLQEAGLLSEVSTLLTRAKVRDEGQLRRMHQQAKDLDTQIKYKLSEIEKMRTEVEVLRTKRKRCDDEVGGLRKRLESCQNAIREIPNSQTER